MSKLREFLKGKKTYIMAAIGIAAAVAAWADGQIELAGLLAAAWAAVQTAFLRAGISNGKGKT